MPDDPDPRFTPAEERTFRAWWRTALGLIAVEVAVPQRLPESALTGAREMVSVVPAALGVGLAAGGIRRWRQVQQAMTDGRDLPVTRVPHFLGVMPTLRGLSAPIAAGSCCSSGASWSPSACRSCSSWRSGR